MITTKVKNEQKNHHFSFGFVSETQSDVYDGLPQYFSVKRQSNLGVGWVEERNPILSTVRWVSPPLNPTYHSYPRSIAAYP
ncbi:hypothetical protein [Nostoc sp.]|uniref:hypothetical protein n=1 Tax=Nostoc sp. TaxID=1180 RepID=UPI002FF58A94